MIGYLRRGPVLRTHLGAAGLPEADPQLVVLAGLAEQESDLSDYDAYIKALQRLFGRLATRRTILRWFLLPSELTKFTHLADTKISSNTYYILQ